MFSGTVNANVFETFMLMCVLPALMGTSARLIMTDNAPVHCAERLHAMTQAAGHLLIFRPIHRYNHTALLLASGSHTPLSPHLTLCPSPDFAPVEYCFAQLSKFLQHYCESITQQNFKDACRRAIANMSVGEIRSYFADCYYPVAGYAYKPYLGQQ